MKRRAFIIMPASDESGAQLSAAMEDTVGETARVRECSIILVHGTWGRGFFPKRRGVSLCLPKRWWFEEESPFRARLEGALKNASLDWPVRSFLWSGANSVHARDGAARELADQLRKELQDDPDARAVIIAHSHGGNVALRALQHLNSMAGQVKLITLATPFLRVFARRWQISYMPATFVLVSVSLILILSYLLGIEWILSAIGLADIEVKNLDLPVLAIAIVLGLGTGNFITYRLFAMFTNLQAALVIEEEARYDTKSVATRMLVIRGVDDEASLSLAAGSIGSRLSYLVLVGVIPSIWAIMSFVPIVVVSVLSQDAYQDAYVVVVRMELVLLGTLLCAPIFVVLPGVFKSIVFGREFLVNALVCDIAVDSVPDSSGQVEAITLKPVEAEQGWQSVMFGLQVKRPYPSEGLFSLRWWSESMRISWREWRSGKLFRLNPMRSMRLHKLSMRHGIYDHPHCVGEIIRWLGAATP